MSRVLSILRCAVGRAPYFKSGVPLTKTAKLWFVAAATASFDKQSMHERSRSWSILKSAPPENWISGTGKIANSSLELGTRIEALKGDRWPLPPKLPPAEKELVCSTWKALGLGFVIARPVGSYWKSLIYWLAK